jgi:hypothetical protein
MSEGLTAVILSYDGRHLLELALPSILAQSRPAEQVIVVDNGSSDGTLTWLAESQPTIQVLRLEQNIGVTAALNRGVEAASPGNDVLLLNNDVELDPGCFHELLAELAAHPQAAVVAAKLLDYHHRELLDGAGDRWSWGGEAHRRGQGERDTGQFDRAEDVFSACGAAALYRRSAVESVGPFDERFFANGEDTDWAFRANLAGYTCRYTPAAVVYHMGSATLGSGVSDFALFHNWRNCIWIVAKNYPASSLLRHLPALALVQARNLAVSIRDRRLRLWLRAWTSALAGLPATLGLRREIQRSRKIRVSRLEALVRNGR